MQDIGLQIKLLLDTLEKKKELLEALLVYTDQQALLLRQPELDMEAFNQIMSNKKKQIDMITTLDDGFQTSFDRIKNTLLNQPMLFKASINKMQTLIKEVNDIGIGVQVQEERNRISFEAKTGMKKAEVKSFQSHKKAMEKYKNVSNAKKKAEVPRFFDSKK